MSSSSRHAPRRRVVRRTIAAALLGLSALGAPAAAAAEVSAAAASAFRDSIGVQLHTNFKGHAYQSDTPDRLAATVADLGIRHVRDGVCIDLATICPKAFAALAGTAGPTARRGRGSG